MLTLIEIIYFHMIKNQLLFYPFFSWRRSASAIFQPIYFVDKWGVTQSYAYFINLGTFTFKIMYHSSTFMKYHTYIKLSIFFLKKGPFHPYGPLYPGRLYHTDMLLLDLSSFTLHHPLTWIGSFHNIFFNKFDFYD